MIFGGEFANIYEAPYHVMLLFNGDYLCGGALITLRHVLTAAHCLEDKAQNPQSVLQVIAGTDNQNYGGEVRYASSVYIHPRYGGQEVSFDVGIIVVSIQLRTLDNIIIINFIFLIFNFFHKIYVFIAEPTVLPNSNNINSVFAKS